MQSIETLCKLILAIIFLLSSTNGSPTFAGTARTFQQPDTPYLPPFCGSIVSGEVATTPQPDGGIIYNISFETTENPNQIMRWYKGALQKYGWKCEDNSSGQFILSAQHGSNINTTVSLGIPKRRGASAQVRLYYQYIGKNV